MSAIERQNCFEMRRAPVSRKDLEVLDELVSALAGYTLLFLSLSLSLFFFECTLHTLSRVRESSRVSSRWSRTSTNPWKRSREGKRTKKRRERRRWNAKKKKKRRPALVLLHSHFNRTTFRLQAHSRQTSELLRSAYTTGCTD